MSDLQRNLVSSGQGVINDVPLGNFHLLAVGIDHYLQWRPLQTAVRGAEALAEILGSDCGFARIIRLLNAEATRSRILAELRQLAEKLKPDDSLLIYFAGHGHLDSLTSAGAWIPVDGERPEEGNTHAAGSWIENHTVKTLLRACKARHILLVSDSCFAGDFLRSHREAPPVITDAYVRGSFARASRQVLTSGSLEPVSDGGAEDHSVFTWFLLRGLRENREPYLLPSQLHDRVKGGVAANAHQTPALGTLHDAAGEVGGEFVLFRKGFGTVEEALSKKRERRNALEQAEADARQARDAQQREIAARDAEFEELDCKIKELENAFDADRKKQSG